MSATTRAPEAVQATTSSSWPRFLRAWLLGTAVLLFAIAAFNVIIDPFYVFGTPRVAGLNRYKPATLGREALAKQFLVARAAPHTLLLGTSKVQVGLDPNSPVWSADDRPVFNLGIPGNTSSHTVHILRDALAVAPVHRVLVLLEIPNMLDVPWTEPDTPFIEHGLALERERLGAVLTRDALTASVNTVLGQWIGLPQGLRPDGMMLDGLFREPTEAEGPGSLFGQKRVSNAATMKQIAEHLHAQPEAPIGQLDTVRAIIRLCQDHGIALDLAIAPVHADLLRLTDEAGLWPRYLEIRTRLAAVVAEAGGGSVKLWDFAGFDMDSTEPIPPEGRHAPPLRWFWESNHFRPELGERILARIYRGEAGFGAPLTPETAADRNRADTEARDRDRALQPGQWALSQDALTR